MSQHTAVAPGRYDWAACLIALVVAFAAAVPAGLAAARSTGSTMLLVVVVTAAGTGVSRWTYARVARRGSRPIDDETCPS